MNPYQYASQIPGLPTIPPLLRDIIGVVVISTTALLIVIVLIWLMRKVIARMQKRIGPNRVGGRYGLLQPIADVMKLLSKEQITPAGADRWAFELAPILIVVASLMVWAVIPFAPGLIGVDLNVGLFYIMAISSISVVTFILAGWGSNNKYALLGAFRSVAQLVSYEVPFILAMLVPIILARTMSTVGIIEAQTVPYALVVPLAALIFFISALAETGSTPFDLMEAESEIVAGFHIEYSGMKFAMFYLAEFLGALFMSALFATVFLGGWNIPLVNLVISAFGGQPIDLAAMGIAGMAIGLIVFLVKTFAVYFLFMWIRSTWPRVRVDQILAFNWKILVPITLLLVLVVAVLDKLIPTGTNELVRSGLHFASNVLIAFVALEVIRRSARRQREMDTDSETVESGTQEVAEAAPIH